MTRLLEGEERLPRYAILTTSRGCPFDCAYCAQKAYNEGSLKVRIRSANDTFAEIRHKYHTMGFTKSPSTKTISFSKSLTWSGSSDSCSAQG